MAKELLKNPTVFKSVFRFYEIDTFRMLIILFLIEWFDCKWKLVISKFIFQSSNFEVSVW